MNELLAAAPEIDVSAIMDAIRQRIEEKKRSGVLKQSEIDEIEQMELLPLPDFLEIPNVYEPHLYPGISAEELSLDVPAPPFDRPSLEIDEGGSGVRGLAKRFMRKTRQWLFPLIRFMTRPIYIELKSGIYDGQEADHRLRHQIERLRIYARLSMQSKEYIKLLHNTINNMIVETSKLKIEEELLKTKLKVMEDKIEFLENRQRALEKKAFTS